MNQEMIESRPTSGKKRVTNTLLQYEAALLNLEKENKAINEALKKKKEESQSKEEEMLKLRAKNQDLLRKLRIRVRYLLIVGFIDEVNSIEKPRYHSRAS